MLQLTADHLGISHEVGRSKSLEGFAQRASGPSSPYQMQRSGPRVLAHQLRLAVGCGRSHIPTKSPWKGRWFCA